MSEESPRGWGPGSWLLLFAGVVGAVAIVTLRAVALGEGHLDEADAAIRQQRTGDAVFHAKAAAAMYVPGAPHVAAGYARLVHLARTSEASGDRDMALSAWRAMRASALESRWVLDPAAREREMADVAIARLTAEMPRPTLAREDTPAEIERRQRALLAREAAARGPWVVALATGLLLCAAGALWARVKLASSKAPTWQLLRLPLLTAAGGLLLYAVAIWRA